MTDWDSNAINAIGSPWDIKEPERCRCGATRIDDCYCADELRDRQRDNDEE